MYKIIGPRRSGKTTRLIMLAAKHGAAIVTFNNASANNIRYTIGKIDKGLLDIINVYTITEVNALMLGKEEREREIVVDEIDLCMQNLLRGKIIGLSIEDGSEYQQLLSHPKI